MKRLIFVLCAMGMACGGKKDPPNVSADFTGRCETVYAWAGSTEGYEPVHVEPAAESPCVLKIVPNGDEAEVTFTMYDKQMTCSGPAKVGTGEVLIVQEPKCVHALDSTLKTCKLKVEPLRVMLELDGSGPKSATVTARVAKAEQKQGSCSDDMLMHLEIKGAKLTK